MSAENFCAGAGGSSPASSSGSQQSRGRGMVRGRPERSGDTRRRRPEPGAGLRAVSPPLRAARLDQLASRHGEVLRPLGLPWLLSNNCSASCLLPPPSPPRPPLQPRAPPPAPAARGSAQMPLGRRGHPQVLCARLLPGAVRTHTHGCTHMCAHTHYTHMHTPRVHVWESSLAQPQGALRPPSLDLVPAGPPLRPGSPTCINQKPRSAHPPSPPLPFPPPPHSPHPASSTSGLSLRLVQPRGRHSNVLALRQGQPATPQRPETAWFIPAGG